MNRKALYKVLKSIACPPVLLQLIVSFHEDMEACIQYDGSISDYFQIKVGVKQGYVLPLLCLEYTLQCSSVTHSRIAKMEFI